MKTYPNKISCLILDENEVYLSGLTSIVHNCSIVGQVCSAKNLQELNDGNRELVFDIVIVDVDMDGLDIIAFIKTIIKRNPEAKILLLSNVFDIILLKKCFDKGAMGFHTKNISSDELHFTIDELLKGKKVLNDNIRNKLNHDRPLIGSDNLSSTCKELLFLISHELPNKQIADALILSPKTIEYHRSHLFKVLRIKNMVGLGVYAVRNKLYFNSTLLKKFAKWI